MRASLAPWSSSALVLAASLGLVPAAAAQAPTRADQWRALREEKRRRLAPPRAGWLERTLLQIEKAERPAITEINLFGFYPRPGAIGWGSKPALGVRYWQPDLGSSAFDVAGSAFFSLNEYYYFDVQAGLIPHIGRRLPPRSNKGEDVSDLAEISSYGLPRFDLYGAVRARQLTEVDFYGLGAGSSPESLATFLLRDSVYEAVGAFRPSPRVTFFGRGGYMKTETGPGRSGRFPSIDDLFDDDGAPGLLEEPDFAYASGSLLLDGRDRPGNPHRGAMLALTARRFDDVDRDDFAFTRLEMDARAFLPVFSPQRVLALRVQVTADDPDDGHRVPFYLQETLGGSHTLRGYPSFRFRAERLALFQAEYRWEAAPAVELVLFWEGGAVRRADEDWDLGDLATDWGAGLRLKTYQDVIARFEVAWSDEATRVILRLNRSF
jgi:hypothetical protein